MKKALGIIFALIAPGIALAWDGTDIQTGASVTIESGNLVRTGNDIEVYDSDRGEYRNMTVESISRYGSSVEIEVYDNDTGDTTTLEMDD